MNLVKFSVIILGTIIFIFTIKFVDSSIWFFPPDFKKLKLKGDEIRLKIENYHDINNAYPRSLEQLNINNSITWYGYWQYNPSGGEIKIGDYSRDGFVLFWNKNSQKWEVNS